jgi:hypothetical protein
MKGGDGVDQLGLAAVRGQAFQQRAERLDVQAVLVEWNLVRLGLGVTKGLQRADEGGRFDDHHISGIDQQMGNQIDTLRAAGGDQQVISAGRYSFGVQLTDEQVEEWLRAGDRAVLEGIAAVRAQDLRAGSDQCLDGKRARIREAIGEWDDAGGRGRAGTEQSGNGSSRPAGVEAIVLHR